MIRALLGRPGRSALIVALAFGATAALAQTPPAPAPADPNAVVATVNGINLTEREVQLALSELAPGGAGIDEQKREQLIGFLINVKLIAKAAEEQKLGEGPDFEARL